MKADLCHVALSKDDLEIKLFAKILQWCLCEACSYCFFGESACFVVWFNLYDWFLCLSRWPDIRWIFLFWPKYLLYDESWKVLGIFSRFWFWSVDIESRRLLLNPNWVDRYTLQRFSSMAIQFKRHGGVISINGAFGFSVTALFWDRRRIKT